jgi:lipopolysaccharide/colanic/teichoic acid biosynthesis glycosyltransferase
MYKVIKRFIDIVLAAVALVILLPLFLPICIVLLLTGEHKVFYFQKRVGFRNRPFYIWKFATMLKNSPNMGMGLMTIRNDPRVTTIGKILRMTKINELPQVINILLGDMSIVGPRPLVEKTFDPYPDHVKEKIFNIRPGLTGIGSIIFRDEENLLTHCSTDPKEFYNKHISPAKGELELWYQRNMGFVTDCKLIFLTALVVVSPDTSLLKKWLKGLPKTQFSS